MVPYNDWKSKQQLISPAWIHLYYDERANSQYFGKLAETLGFPVATMTFPQNSLRVSCDVKPMCLEICTPLLLRAISKKVPADVHLPDSQEAYWKQRQATLQKSQTYDWTYWCENHDTLSWSTTDESINYRRLASTSEPVRHFDSLYFYEDELADNGITRVMDYGFFIRVRCFVRLDYQLLKCVETRYYHEFDRGDYILRERRYHHDDYSTFFSMHGKIDRNDLDSIVSHLTVTRSIKDKYNFT